MRPLSPKFLVYFFAGGLGLNALSRWKHRNQLVVLSYHGVVSENRSADSSLYVNTVSTAEFQAQLSYLKRYFAPVSVAEVIAAWDSGYPLPRNAVLLTFDDGYRNNWTLAAPLLIEHAVPAVFFASTGYIGGQKILWPDNVRLRVAAWKEPQFPWPEGSPRHTPAGVNERRKLASELTSLCKALTNDAREQYLQQIQHGPLPDEVDHELFDFMSWDELKSLSAAGFEIGSHTVTHPILSRCTSGRITQELLDSKQSIEQHCGRPCRVLAYPNGNTPDYNAEVQSCASSLGYQMAFAVHDRISQHMENRFSISRVGVPGHQPSSLFAARVSGTYFYLKG